MQLALNLCWLIDAKRWLTLRTNEQTHRQHKKHRKQESLLTPETVKERVHSAPEGNAHSKSDPWRTWYCMKRWEFLITNYVNDCEDWDGCKSLFAVFFFFLRYFVFLKIYKEMAPWNRQWDLLRQASHVTICHCDRHRGGQGNLLVPYLPKSYPRRACILLVKLESLK